MSTEQPHECGPGKALAQAKGQIEAVEAELSTLHGDPAAWQERLRLRRRLRRLRREAAR